MPDKPIKPKSKAILSTAKYIKRPLTDINLVDEMIKRGYSSDRDLLLKMTPEERFSLLPENTDISWEKVKKGTANAGKYKIYQTVEQPLGSTYYGDRVIKNPSSTYFDEFENGGFLDFLDKNKSGIASASSFGGDIIDMITTPTTIKNNKININEGAAAGKGALKGLAAGASFGPLGMLAGAAIGGIGSFIGANKQEKRMQDELDEQLIEEQFTKDVNNRLTTMSKTPTYMPVARQGGFIVYNGETHEGPNGGILVDQQGNPTGLSNSKPIALTENKEVAKYDSTNKNTYIYSDSLGFAKPASRLVHKYKLDDPDSLLYSQYKNDLLLQNAVDKQFDNLTQAQEFTKETDTDSNESIPMFRKGGSLTSTKAKEILKDGTVHGNKLTAKQRRYMGWVAGDEKELGGFLTKKNEQPLLPKYEGEPGETSYITSKEDMKYGPTLTDLFSNIKLKGNASMLGPLYEINSLLGKNPFTKQSSVEQQRIREVLNKKSSPGFMNYLSESIGQTTPYGAVTGRFYEHPEDNIPTNKLEWWQEDLPRARYKDTNTSTNTQSTNTQSTNISNRNPVYLSKVRIKPLINENLNTGLQKSNIPIKSIDENIESYSPILSPLGHIASLVSGLSDYRALLNAEPQDVNLPRVGAERISLARQRLINERNAEAARAMNITNARNLGTNAGVATANISSANTGVNRLLGEQNMASLMNEEMTNAQMQQQADMVNAELAAQEGLFNTQQRNAFRMAKARLNPLSTLARTAASYAADNAAYKKGYETAELLAPNMEIYKDPDATFMDWLLTNRGTKVRAKS